MGNYVIWWKAVADRKISSTDLKADQQVFGRLFHMYGH